LKKLQTNTEGYKSVRLYKNSRGKGYKVHRLVLLAFSGKPDAGTEASHIDGNKNNNCIDNLLWETPLQNVRRWVCSKNRDTIIKE